MQGDVGGADLLQSAREALTVDVLPGLSGPQRYAALMVVNALRMIEREFAANGCVFPDPTMLRLAEQLRPTQQTIPHCVCAAIRAGDHDADVELYRSLYARVIEVVAITRPEVLTSVEKQQNSMQTMPWEAANGSDERS